MKKKATPTPKPNGDIKTDPKKVKTEYHNQYKLHKKELRQPAVRSSFYVVGIIHGKSKNHQSWNPRLQEIPDVHPYHGSSDRRSGNLSR